MTSATPDGQSPVYLDELTPGRRFTTQRYELEEAELKACAAQFDPQPFHLDAEAARRSVFGGLVASGWRPRPTRAGDVLYVESEVLVKPSRRGDRGVVTLRSQTCNQRGEVLPVFTARLLVSRRLANAGSQLSCDQC
jgi:acyl dehydratase